MIDPKYAECVYKNPLPNRPFLKPTELFCHLHGLLYLFRLAGLVAVDRLAANVAVFTALMANNETNLAKNINELAARMDGLEQFVFVQAL